MHGQAEQLQHPPPPAAGFADPPSSADQPAKRSSGLRTQLPGLALYAGTLICELPAALARGLIAYVGAATLGELIVPGLSASAIAWVAASAPLAWSALAVLRPSHGRLWRRRSGARRPSAAERGAVEDALSLFVGRGELATPCSVYVLDDPLPSAAVRGRALILSRGLLDADAIAAVLAHELGHLRSLDGVLTEALDRLRLRPATPRASLANEGGAKDASAEPAGWAYRLLRATSRLACGGLGERALASLWVGYWRGREYAADAHAAALGQGEDLARHLTEQELPFDLPVPHLLASPALHPPTALRVERLQEVEL